MARSRQALAPERFSIIAQRFNAGNFHPRRISPEGTADRAQSQPSLRDSHPLIIEFPTLKRWANLDHPSGMISCTSWRHG